MTYITARNEGIFNFKSKTLKTKFLILFFLTILLHNSYSQEYDPYTYQDIDEKKVLSDKVFFGGGLGLQFGTFTLIKLTPEIGFRPVEILETGIGAYYMYSKNFVYHISSHVYGGSGFARLYVFQNFFLKGEYELLNVDEIDYTTGYYSGRRIFVPGLLGGIGYRQQVGKRSAFLTTVLYNFTMTENTPYYNPVFKVSFIF